MNIATREELRRLTLGWLDDRAALAFNAASINRGVNREMSHTIPETEETIAFLASAGFVAETPNPLGGTKFWKITAAGTIAHERG
jgi:hypothetical protein